MNPEQEPEAQEKLITDSIQQIEENLRLLNWQIYKIEKMIRIALEQVKVVNLSAP
jgi:hypothetical protein